MLTSLILAGTLSAPTDQPACPCAAAPRYYFILFGGQSVPFHHRTGHTWATWVKATPVNGVLMIESKTISWLPAVGPVEPLHLRRVRGKNYDLDETFAIAQQDRARVSMWGPFEIDADRYERAQAQARDLESGVVSYRVLDTIGFRRHIQHCVHAVTFADPKLQYRFQPVLQVGEPGTSRLAARYLRTGAFLGAAATHDWLIPVLGLDRYGVVRREPGEFIPRQWR